MVSFDVESLFTSIPLDEFIDLAITCIYQGNPCFKISATDLKTLLSFATAETHSLRVCFMIKSMRLPWVPPLLHLQTSLRDILKKTG